MNILCGGVLDAGGSRHSMSVILQAAQSESGDAAPQTTIFDLPWDDVIFPHILPALPLPTLFQLRRVCTLGLELIKDYFSLSKDVNIARIAGKVTPSAFLILTGGNTNIHRLNLRNSKDWLTDNVLMPVLKDNPRLQLLDLTSCTSVTSISMQVLSVNCPQLQNLILRDCHWLTAEGLTVVALNCCQLEKIDLTGCWNVNDDAIIALVMNCKKLKSISVSKIYGLTDRAFSVVARSCPELNHINIQGCWRLSDDSVRFLGEYCKSLKILQVRECHQVTEATLAKLRENKVKMDVRQPPDYHERMDLLSLRLRNRLNVQI